MLRSCLILFMGLLFFGCKEPEIVSAPEKLLDEETYLDIFIDLHLFNAMVQAVDSVTNEDSLRLALFEHYSTSEEDFKASHAYYQSQPSLHKVRLDSAAERIARTLEELNRIDVEALPPIQQNDNNPVLRRSE